VLSSCSERNQEKRKGSVFGEKRNAEDARKQVT
jgi:hypothetical protein